ncbi:hypothetical protein Fmac_028483 [Flemingia macrophylla]|uniref:HTH myb-type domain-containing protein n=1 Tax=Flemingia macrophylla TaxID=520843 RepID=A0ABD1L7M6_9FABA
MKNLRTLLLNMALTNWNLIADHLEGRSGKRCRLRWFNQLDPRINRRSFSKEEKDRLFAAHQMVGPFSFAVFPSSPLLYVWVFIVPPLFSSLVSKLGRTTIVALDLGVKSL